MTRRMAGSIVGAGVTAAVVAIAVGACSDQPRVRCAAARGTFAATYRPAPGSDDCAGLTGDMLAVQTYNGSNADRSPNWDDATMAIAPSALGDVLAAAGSAMVTDPNPDNKPYGLGRFESSEPAADDFCAVPALSPARVQLPAIPAGMDEMGNATPAVPATDIEYRWENVRVYVTAAANGTMFTSDLTVRQGACTARYVVDALYPAISCLVPPPPEEPADGGVAEPPAPPEPAFDETLCSAVPVPGRPLGSGISPDVATRCDHVLGHCVLAKSPPSPP